MKAKREKGRLVIEISEHSIVEGVHLLPGNETPVVTDRERFLDHIARHACSIGDSGDFGGCSHLTRLIDELVTHAIESGAGCEC